MYTAAVEDYLKVVYELTREEGRATTTGIADRLGVAPASVSGMFKKLVEMRLIEHTPYQGVVLTSAGQKIALEVIRHHRLVELYLAEALGIPWDKVHEEANRLEHAISVDVADRMAAALGNPLSDPHGAPIPHKDGTIAPVATRRLSELQPGDVGRVAEVIDEDAAMLRSLASMGLFPNVTVQVLERDTGSGELTLRIGAGEIFGIAGIDGHGQRHLAEAIAGQRAATSGRVLLCGSDITREPVKRRQRLGVRYVTDDRLQEGIVGPFSVALNLVLKRVGERPLWRFGRMDRPAVEREAERLIDAYEIRTPSPDAPAGTLSGGNIQKILLARELAHGPRVVVFHKPGYGLDLRTVRRVRDDIRRFAEDGGAALLISTDLDELLELADSIAVLSRGRIVGRVENDGNRVRERIGELMVGAGEPS